VSVLKKLSQWSSVASLGFAAKKLKVMIHKNFAIMQETTQNYRLALGACNRENISCEGK